MQKGILLIIGFILAIQVQAADTCKAMIQANFDVQDVCLGDEAVFNNTSVSDPNESSYTWKFDDGNFSSQRHPKYRYSSAQTYTVWLKVVLKNGCTDSIAKVFDVIPLPFCAFTVSVDYKQNQQRTVQATPKLGVMPTYKWTYLYTQTSNNQILNFVFPADSIAKNFKAEKIVLKVTNQFGCSARDSIQTIFARTPEGDVENILVENTDFNFANPSSGQLLIYNKGNDYTFQLIDITGQLIKSGVLTKGNNRLEIDQTGIFFLKSIDMKGQYFVNKIIIQ
jgi:hypothetical protein